MSIHQSNLEKFEKHLRSVALPRIFPHPDARVIKSLCQTPKEQFHQITSEYPLSQPSKEAYESSSNSDDGRKRVEETENWPYSAHGLVSFCFKEDQKWGTGVLIGPNIVLTAAHNIYDYENKVYADEDTMQFLPAINDQQLPFGFAEVRKRFVPESYIENKKDDYGILILEEPIGEETGYFGLACLDPEELENKVVQICGYPYEKVQDKPNNYEMWGMEGRVKISDKDRSEIHYSIKTSLGQGGSGVWFKQGENYYVCGVHNSENKATLLTRSIYKQIYKWIEENSDKEMLQFDQIKKLQLRNLKNFEIDEKCVSLITQNFDNLTTLDLTSMKIGLAEIRALIEAPWINLSVLRLSQSKIGSAEVQVLATNTSWKNLSKLNLSKNKISAEGAKFLAQNESWRNLSELNLSRNNLGDQGAVKLAKNTSWTRLSKLKLNDNKISNIGAGAIAQNELWTQLSEVNFNINPIGDKGVEAIVPKDLTKESLKKNELNDESAQELTINPIGDKGVQALVQSSSQENLTKQSLEKNELNDESAQELTINPIGDKGVQALVQSSSQEDLPKQSLEKNELNDESAQELTQASKWINLTKLSLDKTELSDEGAGKLAQCSFWMILSELSLSGNNISCKGAQALGENTSWINLLKLNLSKNNIHDKGVKFLAQNRSWARLSNLDLSENNISETGALELVKNTSWIKLSKLNLLKNNISDKRALEVALLIISSRSNLKESKSPDIQVQSPAAGEEEALESPQILKENAEAIFCSNFAKWDLNSGHDGKTRTFDISVPFTPENLQSYSIGEESERQL